MISVSKLHKTMGSKQLFEGLSFTIEDRQRIGLLGSNGAGKSTLLKLLAGLETPDSGDISYRKGLRIAFVSQQDDFEDQLSILQTITDQLQNSGLSTSDIDIQAPTYLSLAGFEDFDVKVSSLSGGWKKRLSLAIAFAKDPDILFLDEPTNHMDWDGILWLEDFIKSYRKAFIVVSHDRAFLNNVCNKTMEINSLYRDGFLAFNGGYQEFLKRKEEYSQAQIDLQDSLSNKARREVEWLRAGVKARTTKSQARAKEAYHLLDELSAVKSRNQSGQSKVRVEIDHAGKKSKKFIELKNLNVFYGENYLINDLDLILGPKNCLGLLGSNGSGKTSLLKVISGAAENYTGDFFKAENLKIVYFDQKREALPQNIDLISYLGDGSDYTIFKEQSIHVASYASRFLFSSDKMKLKIAQLSGGEQTRLLIAKLLLQPADVLILDEPTNDLDINSIEVLEESLSSFGGLVLLVSHDRYFMSQLCQKYLALEGAGSWHIYADLKQWLNKDDTKSSSTKKEPTKPIQSKNAKKKVKLSYKEKRQLETIEQDIENAELALAEAQKALSDSQNFSDHNKMQECLSLVEEKQKKVDDLYRFWEDIDEKF